jgi:hypothetical protein
MNQATFQRSGGTKLPTNQTNAFGAAPARIQRSRHCPAFCESYSVAATIAPGQHFVGNVASLAHKALHIVLALFAQPLHGGHLDERRLEAVQVHTMSTRAVLARHQHIVVAVSPQLARVANDILVACGVVCGNKGLGVRVEARSAMRRLAALVTAF